jgi:hypothetical protein
MSVVVTGVAPGDTVYLGASTNSNDPTLTQYSPNLLIGSKDLTIVDSFVNNEATILTEAESGARTASVRFNVDLGKLASAGFSLADQSKFYLQAMTVPQSAAGLTGASYWAALHYSPLVTVSTDAGKSQYGACYGY